MAVSVNVPKVLEIDIVLAGKVAGDTLVTEVNPEGRDLVVRSMMHSTTAKTTPWHGTGDQITGLRISVGGETFDFGVNSDGFETVVSYNNTAAKWAAGASLTVKIRDDTADFITDPLYVGKLYVEYWGGTSEEYGRALNMERYYRFRRIPILPRLG